jgi:hypothetical protein
LISSISICRQCNPIDRSLVPNLRRLKISWNNYGRLEHQASIVAPTQLSTRDVFFRLTLFSLVVEHLKNEVIHDLLSMLSTQCSYSLDILRRGETASMALGQSITSTILLNTFRELKGWKPMEVTRSLL